ncbi:MAG: MFS transporter [Methanobacteriaceae archaeon]|nr:MFS transporter [Methanobacteriaceae archaeon]
MDNDSNPSEIGWTAIIIVSLSSFIIALDSTFMNVAIGNLVADLNTTIPAIQIIISVYALTMASLMLLGGKMQDLVGRKDTYTIGAVIFGFGTAIAALSVNSTMLLIGWSILEGIGAALMTPATASIIAGTYSGKNREFAMGIRTSVATLGAGVGPLVGGFLTTFFSWRWGFGLELIIIIIILLLSRKLKYFPPSMKFSELDKIGVLLSSLGILIFVIGILSINSIENLEVPVFITGIGILLLILFYFREKRVINKDKRPLTDIRLFKNRNFALGTLSRLVLNLALAGAVFILPVFFQQETGADAFTTGLVILPLTIGVLIFSIASSKISNRIAPHHLISIGFLIALLSSYYLSSQFDLNTHVYNIIPGTLFLGMGLGLALPLTANVILSSVSSDKQADATGIMSTSSNLGSATGTALIGLILLLGTMNGLYSAYDEVYPGQFTKSEINEKLDIFHEKKNTTTYEILEGNKNTPLYTIINKTVRNAMKTAFIFVSIIFLISFIISLFIKPLKLQ